MTGSALTTIDVVPAGIKAGTAHMAFPVYDMLPPGCCPWPIKDGACEPHIHAGEHAVIDTGDRAIVPGELFLVRQRGGGVVWQIIQYSAGSAQARAGDNVVGLYSYNRPRRFEDVDRWIREGRELYLGDGAIEREVIEPRIIGRVVGVLG